MNEPIWTHTDPATEAGALDKLLRGHGYQLIPDSEHPRTGTYVIFSISGTADMGQHEYLSLGEVRSWMEERGIS